MIHNSSDSEGEKKLASLVKLFPKGKSTLLVQKIEQKEARAILGYITYLEAITANSRTQPNSASKELTIKKDYNQHDLDTGLLKLLGIASDMHPDKKVER